MSWVLVGVCYIAKLSENTCYYYYKCSYLNRDKLANKHITTTITVVVDDDDDNDDDDDDDDNLFVTRAQ